MLDTLFSAAGTLVLPVWLALAVAPTHRWTQRVAAGAVPALLAVAYVVLLVASLRDPAVPGGGFGSLDAVAALFADRRALLAGWLHYLAFDLVVGAWEARDAGRAGVPRWALAPCLVLTFMAGPAGLLVYRLVRTAWTRRLFDQSAAGIQTTGTAG